MVIRQGQQYRETSLLFALSKDRLISVEQDVLLPRPGGDLRVRVYRPGPAPGLPIHVFVHGGGFWLGSIDERVDRVVDEEGLPPNHLAWNEPHEARIQRLVAVVAEQQQVAARTARWLASGRRRLIGNDAGELLPLTHDESADVVLGQECEELTDAGVGSDGGHDEEGVGGGGIRTSSTGRPLPEVGRWGSGPGSP